MGSFTTLRPLLSARAPMLASVRTHLGYIPFEGRTAAPPNQMVKFTLELKKANMQPVTKVHKLKIGFRIIVQSFTGHLHLWPNDWELPQPAQLHVLLEHEEDPENQPEAGNQGFCGGRSQWTHHPHEPQRWQGSWGASLRNFSLNVLFEMLLMSGVQIRCGNLTELEIASVVNHYLLPLVKVTYFVPKLSTSWHLHCRRKRKQHWPSRRRVPGREVAKRVERGKSETPFRGVLWSAAGLLIDIASHFLPFNGTRKQPIKPL